MTNGGRRRCPNRLQIAGKKPAQIVLAGFSESGSSDWTRTSDIRINSPPFDRLNYRGIAGTGRILAAWVQLVKALFDELRSDARKSSGSAFF